MTAWTLAAIALAVLSAPPSARETQPGQQTAAGQSAAGAPNPAGAGEPSPVEAALTILERSSRSVALYAALSENQITVVAELSAASIQAGRFADGADVAVEAVSNDGIPVARAQGRIEAGSYAAAVPLTIPRGITPARVTVRLTGTGTPAVEDWVKLPRTRGSLLADPLAYRSGSRLASRPVAAFDFARNERIRIEWRVLGALDRRGVRLLDRHAQPLPVDLPLTEDPDKKVLVVDMSLSGLGRGDFLIELTGAAGSLTERRLLAIRVR